MKGICGHEAHNILICQCTMSWTVITVLCFELFKSHSISRAGQETWEYEIGITCILKYAVYRLHVDSNLDLVLLDILHCESFSRVCESWVYCYANRKKKYFLNFGKKKRQGYGEDEKDILVTYNLQRQSMIIDYLDDILRFRAINLLKAVSFSFFNLQKRFEQFEVLQYHFWSLRCGYSHAARWMNASALLLPGCDSIGENLSLTVNAYLLCR